MGGTRAKARIGAGGRNVARTVFLDTAEDVVHVVREEAARVEHGLDQPGDGPQRHFL